MLSCCRSASTRHAVKPRHAAQVRQSQVARRLDGGGPTVKGKMHALLQDGSGFRIEHGRHWYVYNDTTDRELVFTVVFTSDPAPHAAKRGRTVVTRANASSGRQRASAIECSVVVHPLETLPFVTFASTKAMRQCRYCASSSTRVLSDAYVNGVHEAMARQLQFEQRTMQFYATQKNLTEEDILYACRRSKLPYLDLCFPPTSTSLRQPQDTCELTRMTEMVWGRPRTYLPPCVHHRIGVLRHRPSPDCIQQGRLGDCWLLSAIAVVADSTTMIRDLFRHPVGSASKRRKERRVGAYRVYLNKGGWWRNVIVDDYLPTVRTVRAFATTARDPCELWVSLLEKAYAKVHGSYGAIAGGDALHALRDLTGFPVYNFAEAWERAADDEDAASAFFKNLLRYRKKGYLVCVSTPSAAQLACDSASRLAETDYTAVGLNCGHAYAVLSVRQFFLPSIRLLRIRNPWGNAQREWCGAWGRESRQWRKHPFVRHACRPSEKPDGTFWMEWRDVVRYFDGGGACMVRKTWLDYRLPCTFDGVVPSLVLRIEVRRRQRLFLTLSQQDRRTHTHSAAYSSMLIVVSRAVTRVVEEKSVEPTALGPESKSTTADVVPVRRVQEFMALSTRNPEMHTVDTCVFTCARDLGMELELEPQDGPYYVIPRVMVAEPDKERAFTLGLLTPTKPSASGLHVGFVRLPPDCAAFRHVSPFSTDGEVAVRVEFQYKKRGSVPRLKSGTCIEHAEYVKEHYPFPY